MTLLTQGVVELKLPPDQVIHDIPLTQLLALSACNAWLQGMQPAGETYADMEFMRCLDAIRNPKEQ